VQRVTAGQGKDYHSHPRSRTVILTHQKAIALLGAGATLRAGDAADERERRYARWLKAVELARSWAEELKQAWL